MNIKIINRSIKQRDNLADNLKWFATHEAYQNEKKATLEALKVIEKNKKNLLKGIKEQNDKLNTLKTLDNVTIYDSYDDLLYRKLSNSDDEKSDYKELSILLDLCNIDTTDYIIEVDIGNGETYLFNDILEAYDLA